MKKSIIVTLVFAMVLLSNCGPKITKSSEEIKKESNSYIEKVDNQNLEKKVSEGALTDAEGFKDIGTFKLSYDYDKATKTLFRIENIETTKKKITENFYFQDNKLVFISSKIDNETLKKIYVSKGKVFNESNMDTDYQNILLTKSKMFQKDFKNVLNKTSE